MNNSSKSSILPLKRGHQGDKISIEKLQNSLDKKYTELQTEVDRHADELKAIQESFAEQVTSLSDKNKDEFKKIQKLFKNISNELDKFKSDVRSLIDDNFAAEREKMIASYSIEEKKISAIDAEAIRRELIEGVKLLGARVTTAVGEMDKRFEHFKKEITGNRILEKTDLAEETSTGQDDSAFGNIKESPLIEVDDDFEVISKNEIQKLGELFKKQSQRSREYLREQEEKLMSVEHLFKLYEEETNKAIESLNKKTKRNLILTISGIVILVVLAIVFNFVI